MNSRQRRGVLLLLISVLCAFGVFAGVLSVISDVNSKVGPETSAYQVKSDIKPYTALSPDQFEKVKMPKRWLSTNAVRDIDDVQGKIAVHNLKKGSLLQSDMVVARPALEEGEQEIAIMIDAATGVAGKIDPGATVNIYATFGGEDGRTKPTSRVIVAGAKVIDVGTLTALEPDKDDSEAATEAVPITFGLQPKDAQRVAYAESFADNVRLALVAPGSDSSIPRADRSYTLDQDK